MDVSRGDHHATPAIKKAFTQAAALIKRLEVFGKLQAKHGTVLVVGGQPDFIAP
ncbi:hypothetical protein [Streptomyces sp. NPDC019539]|uniref:hypothetical protein n=1 Tax=Streptomyces sp. NPDC019539 TaxID=3365063 RepID=UPI003788E836